MASVTSGISEGRALNADAYARSFAVFLQMQRDFAGSGATGITEDAARSWVAGLVSERRSARTVREVWLAASRSVFSWAARHKHIHRNAFADIKVDVPRQAPNRETKAFKPDEVLVILRAALLQAAAHRP